LTLSAVAACSDTSAGADCKATRTCSEGEAAGAAGVETSSEGDTGGAGGASEVAAEPSNDAEAGTAAAAVGGAAGQSGDEEPPAAAAGAMGEGGAGEVVVPQPECLKAADCDDHIACNGAEQCNPVGNCVAGTPPVCQNPDATNCEVACAEGVGTYQCVVTAKDADEDGHATALCAQKPGDDCDDTQKTTYPGAPELCDGIDNDCDKKIDLADGLTFAGKSRWVGQDVDNSVMVQGAVMAWSDAAKLYGLFWQISGSQDLALALYDAKGVRKAGPTTVGYASEATSLAIAAGAGGFGVVWNSAEQHSEFRSVSAQGVLGKQSTLGEREGVPTSALAVAWSDVAKRWEIAADHGVGSVNASGVAQDFVHKFTKALDIYGLEVAAAGNYFLIGVSNTGASGSAARVYRYAASEEVTTTDTIWFDNPQGSTKVRLAGNQDGSFGLVAAADDGTSYVTLYDTAGVRSCTHSETSFVSALTGTAAGYTLVAYSDDGKASFQDLSRACEAGEWVTNAFSAAYEPHISASPSSFGTVWHDKLGRWLYSIFGSNYCN
jgi:hypothetical protein